MSETMAELSGTQAISYSSTETFTGEIYNGKPVYAKYFSTSTTTYTVSPSTENPYMRIFRLDASDLIDTTNNTVVGYENVKTTLSRTVNPTSIIFIGEIASPYATNNGAMFLQALTVFGSTSIQTRSVEPHNMTSCAWEGIIKYIKN